VKLVGNLIVVLWTQIVS